MKRFAFIFLFAAIVLVSGFIIASDVTNPGSGSGSTTIINNFINQGTQTYLVSGGEVSWLSNLIFRVNAAQYVIDGVTYNSTATNVTLSAADATNPRIDVFTLNTSSVVEVEEGTPSTSPAKSTVPANQLEISFVQINPNETTPAIVQTWIYRENTEWTTAGVGTTWAFASTNQAYNGTKSVSGVGITNQNEYATFTAAATDISNVGLVQLSIWVDNTWAVGNYLRARFFNGTTAVSGYVNLASGYGMNYTTTGAWQVVTVPIGAFALSSTTVTQLRIEGFGTGSKNFYIDDVNLQAGLPQVSAVATYKTVTGNTGSTTANSPSDVLNIRGFNGVQVDVTNDRIDIYPPAAPFNPYNQLYSGSVTWIATNHYFVSPLSYAIQGVGYTTTSTNIYLTAAPNAPTNRVDYIVATDQSTVAVVTGTPATTALTPLVSASTQLPITAALQITGGQTTPDGFSAELLYDENVGPAAEWTVSTTGANINAAETTGSIYSGSKVISYDGTVTFADYATITKATDKALIGTYWLSFAIKLDAVPSNVTISIDSYLDGSWIGGALADLELWGVNKNDTVNWQVVSIPINVITGSSAWVDTFEIGSQPDTRIDKIRLVAGTGPTYPQSAFSRVITDGNDGYDVEAYTPHSVFGIKGLGGITTTNYGGSVYINGAALAGLQTAVSTNLAAGIPTVVGSQLRIGTNVTSVGLFSGSGTTGSVTSAAANSGKYLEANGTWSHPQPVTYGYGMLGSSNTTAKVAASAYVNPTNMNYVVMQSVDTNNVWVDAANRRIVIAPGLYRCLVEWKIGSPASGPQIWSYIRSITMDGTTTNGFGYVDTIAPYSPSNQSCNLQGWQYIRCLTNSYIVGELWFDSNNGGNTYVGTQSRVAVEKIGETNSISVFWDVK